MHFPLQKKHLHTLHAIFYNRSDHTLTFERTPHPLFGRNKQSKPNQTNEKENRTHSLEMCDFYQTRHLLIVINETNAILYYS